MKERNFKVAFFAITILLLIFSIYYLVKNKDILASDIEVKKLNAPVYNEITIGIAEFDTINPILSTNQDVQYISKLVYDPLIDITEDFRLKESLATEWCKLDNTTYLLKLNENISWQNNNKFTAKDVEYTINYIKGNTSIYNDNVKNIESIEIVNDYTIKLHLVEAEEDFEYMLCFPIVCTESNVGTGKFCIKEVKKDKIILESKDSKKNINVKIYDSIAKLYNAFSKEEVDVITTNNIDYEKYVGRIGYNKKVVCGREFDYLKFNLNNKIFKNREVVQAINYAINKSEIIYNIYNNTYCQAEFPLQYGTYLYNSNVEYIYDPNKAKQILKDAGWRMNGNCWSKNGEKLSIEIKTNTSRKNVAEIIKENLESIGIQATVKEINNSYYKNNLQNLKYDVLLTGNIVSIKPSVKEFVSFDIYNLENKEETYKAIYESYNKNKEFIGLYFNSEILLYSNKVKGNFACNWYNLFYHIDTWYKVI